MRIVFFLYEGLTTLDVIGPHDVLSRLPGVEAISVSPDGGPVQADTGALGLTPTHAMGDIDHADVLVVPGGLEGTFAAAAGLLDGKRATTHWAAIDLLPTYGATAVRERVVIDGDLVTAAGVSAGIDMALTLAARIAGDDTAKAIQLGIEYDPRPPFDCGSPATAPPEIVELAGDVLS